MEYRDYKKRILIWSVGDQKLSHDVKFQRSRTEVRASMTGLRKQDEVSDRVTNFLKDTIRSANVVYRNEIPDLFKVTASG